MTFSLNEGGTGHRDAAVTMQGKNYFFFSLARSLARSTLHTKTRFMTSPAPPYFSNWCTLWVVYLGLRALQLSLSVSSLCDLQHPTRGNKKDTVSSACDICLVHARFHRSLTFVFMQNSDFSSFFLLPLLQQNKKKCIWMNEWVTSLIDFLPRRSSMWRSTEHQMRGLTLICAPCFACHCHTLLLFPHHFPLAV